MAHPFEGLVRKAHPSHSHHSHQSFGSELFWQDLSVTRTTLERLSFETTHVIFSVVAFLSQEEWWVTGSLASFLVFRKTRWGTMGFALIHSRRDENRSQCKIFLWIGVCPKVLEKLNVDPHHVV